MASVPTETTSHRRADVVVESIDVSTYSIPTPSRESDGSATWSATTLVLVELQAGGVRGTGWTYADPAAADVVRTHLAAVVRGANPFENRAVWTHMTNKVRNIGRSGIASYAIAAVDVALWDLRARLLDVPLCDLLGAVREHVPVYGSGGFTSEDDAQLRAQVGGWAREGLQAVKIKVGRDHDVDVERVRVAREAIGPRCGLMIDGNGGYDPVQAIAFAHHISKYDVIWFEQPVDPRDHAGMRRVRADLPPGMALSSGEYITDTADAEGVADVVDVLQADATRCGGYTGLLAIDGFCEVRRLVLSTHCAPMLHLHAAAACLRLRHMEWFVDHVRIESELFDGFIPPENGAVTPNRTRPGHGLRFRHDAAQRYAKGS